MNNNLRITIIIPVYDVEKYIVRCIQSVMQQTYNGNIECILVDDCGHDKSIAIVEQLIAEYKGDFSFHILHHDYNRGLSAARNTGIDEATGEYIYFLDSDDELPINAIQLLVKEVEKHPDVELVQGALQSDVYQDYYDISCFKPHQYVNDNGWIRRNYYCVGKTIPVNGVNKLIKLDFLRKNRLYFKEGIIHEDEHWMFYLVKYLKSMAFVFSPTYIRYLNEGSITTTSTNEKKAKHMGIIVLDWLEHIDRITIKCQLQKILLFYAAQMPYMVWSKEQDTCFLNAITMHLWHEKQFFSVSILYIWRIIRPVRNVKKILRYSYEAISRD